MDILIKIISTVLTPFLFIGASIGSSLAPEPVEPTLGASEEIPVTIAFFETSLASAINSSATTFTLTSAVDKDGTTLASSTYAFVIDEGSSNEEIVLADCTGTTCINVERGISVRTGNTEVTALKKSHRRGASIKITDAPILPMIARILRGEGIVDFTPTIDGNLVTKSYVDALALGSTTVSATYTDDGIVELSTGLEAASSTALGNTTSPLTLHTGISTSTGGTAYTVPVTGADGTIDSNFIPTSIKTIFTNGFSSTTNGTSTWSVPTGTERIKVTLVGAGGDGANNGTDDGGGGGGAGGACYSWYDVSGTTTIQYHIADGGSSEFSWFGGSYNDPVVKATSGTTDSTPALGGSGGLCTVGDIGFGGGDGSIGDDTRTYSGSGGNSIFGGGGAGVITASIGNDANACGAGGGGSGGSNDGGAGYDGCIIIEY